MSRRSSSEVAASCTFGEGRDSTCVPLKWLAIWISDCAATIWISGLAQAASEPQATGADQAFLARIGADRGRQHAGDRSRSSRPARARPRTVKPVSASGGSRRWRPSARARSAGRNGCASFGTSAGARLTMIRRAGSARPEAISAERTRSRASDTALSGRPTMAKAGSPGATCTCTSTARASIPSKATVETR